MSRYFQTTADACRVLGVNLPGDPQDEVTDELIDAATCADCGRLLYILPDEGGCTCDPTEAMTMNDYDNDVYKYADERY